MNEQEKPERDAEVFVKGVKRRTRKKFTAEEKIRIVLEGASISSSRHLVRYRQGAGGMGSLFARRGSLHCVFPSLVPNL